MKFVETGITETRYMKIIENDKSGKIDIVLFLNFCIHFYLSNNHACHVTLVSTRLLLVRPVAIFALLVLILEVLLLNAPHALPELIRMQMALISACHVSPVHSLVQMEKLFVEIVQPGVLVKSDLMFARCVDPANTEMRWK